LAVDFPPPPRAAPPPPRGSPPPPPPTPSPIFHLAPEPSFIAPPPPPPPPPAQPFHPPPAPTPPPPLPHHHRHPPTPAFPPLGEEVVPLVKQLAPAVVPAAAAAPVYSQDPEYEDYNAEEQYKVSHIFPAWSVTMVRHVPDKSRHVFFVPNSYSELFSSSLSHNV
ncbi:MAG: hypothetical protein ACK53Y_24345, partial [bacterium]